MGLWKRLFGRKDEPQPEQPAPAPRPAPEPAPGPTAEPTPEPKRPGRIARLFGRGRKKAAPEEPARPPEPTTPPPPPPSEPPPMPPGPPASGSVDQEEAETGPPKRGDYPNELYVSIYGDWVISETEWTGTIDGTLKGTAVQIFLDAMDAGDEHTAVYLVALVYGGNTDFARMLDLNRSRWDSIDY